jgi:hypothetical protein
MVQDSEQAEYYTIVPVQKNDCSENQAKLRPKDDFVKTARQ